MDDSVFAADPGHSPLSPDLLLAIFHASLDAILIADDSGRHVAANPAAATLLGYSEAELCTMSAGDLAPDEYHQATEMLWQGFVQQGELQGEFLAQTAHGDILVLEYRAVTNIVPGRHLSILRDVTARKEMERSLQRSAQQLQAFLI